MFSKIRQSISAREAFELVQADLRQVEQEISVESVASVEAITTINQYLQAGGVSVCGRPCCCCARSCLLRQTMLRGGWRQWWR